MKASQKKSIDGLPLGSRCEGEFRVLEHNLRDVGEKRIEVLARDRCLSWMGAVVAHVEAMSQSGVLVAVDEFKVSSLIFSVSAVTRLMPL
jgi:hypothetical protein